ncbi:MAG: metallophosphoesterase [Candidatus Omnitrophica bacterium]|nr:metallophosphoesterase [Candidatus Omnitrophota bacterium]
MKIGVIGDTHIPDRAGRIPLEVLEAFKTVDMIIHTGDLVALDVLEQLKTICPNVKAVWGNMDSFEVRSKLPEKEIVKIGKYKIGIMHGFGHPDNLIMLMHKEFKKDKVDLIIFGHSHRPYNKKIDNILYFNPGSVTDTIFAPFNSFGIIEINDKIEARIIKIGSNKNG